jgi:beta propeller repeat protein
VTDGAVQRSPAIWGDRVVWEDYRNGNADIYLYEAGAPVTAPPVQPESSRTAARPTPIPLPVILPVIAAVLLVAAAGRAYRR